MSPKQKRKALEELLTNINTMKARKRMEAIDKVEAAIEIAKCNNALAQTYAIKVLKKTKEYKDALAE